MNSTYFNTSDHFMECFVGSCSTLDLNSCSEMSNEVNISTVELSVDSDGCFSTEELRISLEYQHFTEVHQNPNKVL